MPRANLVIAIGQVIRGKYRLVRVLGDGGMGSVYEASHEILGTRVAIKVLHPELARRTGLIDRFLQEARVAAQIRSPNVVQVMDVDRTEDGTAYIVMELLEGEPLSAILERQGKLPLPIACEYTGQILSALEAAHALGVVHRDLKPENVFLTFAGTKPLLKLIDFGIAKLRREGAQKNLTVAGVVMGTAEYMAPEQAFSADQVDARSDLYAVGVMLYEMIAGRRPVGGEDARIIAMKVERGEVTPLVHAAPDTPREVAGLVHRAMASRPELRFASATEMRLAMEMALAGKRIPTVQLPMQAAMHAAGATGTMQGAPAAEVLAAAAAHARAPDVSPPRHAPPMNAQIGHAMPAHPYIEPAPRTERPPAIGVTPPITHGLESGGAHARRSGAPVWLYVMVPLVIGAGVVGFLAMNADRAPMPIPLVPSFLPPLPAMPTASAPGMGGGMTSPEPNTPLAPLVPSPNAGSHPASHGPSTHPSPTPSSAASVPGMPTTVPDGLPPFTLPSAFPSVLPFPLPSGSSAPLPFPLPSVLPLPFPGVPAPATPPPAQSVAPAPGGQVL